MFCAACGRAAVRKKKKKKRKKEKKKKRQRTSRWCVKTSAHHRTGARTFTHQAATGSSLQAPIFARQYHICVVRAVASSILSFCAHFACARTLTSLPLVGMSCCCRSAPAKFSPRARAVALEHELVDALNGCEAAETVSVQSSGCGVRMAGSLRRQLAAANSRFFCARVRPWPRHPL